jgi:hypothetical protein
LADWVAASKTRKGQIGAGGQRGNCKCASLGACNSCGRARSTNRKLDQRQFNHETKRQVTWHSLRSTVKTDWHEDYHLLPAWKLVVGQRYVVLVVSNNVPKPSASGLHERSRQDSTQKRQWAVGRDGPWATRPRVSLLLSRGPPCASHPLQFPTYLADYRTRRLDLWAPK